MIYYINKNDDLTVLFGDDKVSLLASTLNKVLKNGETATIQKGSNKAFLKAFKLNNQIKLTLAK